MKDKRYFLLFFGDYWDDMWRRRQQLAWRLSKTDMFEHVVYIERPLPITSFVKFLVGRADRDATERWQRVLSNRSWVMPVGEKLSVLTTYAPLPQIGIPWLFHYSERTRDRWLLYKLKKYFSVNKPIVWVSHPQISVEIIKDLEPGLLWYDCTEDFSAWPGLSEHLQCQIQDTDFWLMENADIVTAVSSILYEEKSKVNSNTHLLPNAVDADLFLQPMDHFPIPLELQNVNRPILTFVGGLNEWSHDWELLDQLAILLPDWIILLIGDLEVSRQTKNMLNNHQSIICIGPKSYQELPAYLKYSDICFQFYKQMHGNDTRNSQKIFLYFASGKPIVSTPSADVEVYKDLIEIVHNAKDFVRSVEKIMKSETHKKVKTRQDVAQSNTWIVRAEEISKILNNCLSC